MKSTFTLTSISLNISIFLACFDFLILIRHTKEVFPRGFSNPFLFLTVKFLQLVIFLWLTRSCIVIINSLTLFATKLPIYTLSYSSPPRIITFLNEFLSKICIFAQKRPQPSKTVVRKEISVMMFRNENL